MILFKSQEIIQMRTRQNVKSFKTILSSLVLLLLSGCYEWKILNACKKLELGMNRESVNEIFWKFKLIKEQTILPYPNLTEEEMRGNFKYYHRNMELYPKDLFDRVTMDGNTKVYSYLVKEEYNFPNGIDTRFVSIFYNEKEDEVIGWGLDSSGYGHEPRVWDDKF